MIQGNAPIPSTRFERRAGWRERAAALAALTVPICAVASTSCEGAARFSAERVLTGTVTLTNENALLVESIIPMVLEGSRRTNDVTWKVQAVLTASTASVAEDLANKLEVLHESADRTLRLALLPPKDATLDGSFRIFAPSDLDVRVVQLGGTADVIDMQGTLRIDALTHVRVVGAEDDTVVRIEGGNALVNSALSPGKRVEVVVGRGDIELTVPAAISANIAAMAGPNGGIVIAHPQLPGWAGGGLPYRVTVGGGLATVVLEARTGNIVIRTR